MIYLENIHHSPYLIINSIVVQIVILCVCLLIINVFYASGKFLNKEIKHAPRSRAASSDAAAAAAAVARIPQAQNMAPLWINLSWENKNSIIWSVGLILALS